MHDENDQPGAPFGSLYASAYDVLYGDKNYVSECDAIAAVMEDRLGPSARQATILDVGCGTGSHLIEFVRRGHFVTGVDCSPSMLARAQEKLGSILSATAELVLSDIRSLALPRTYDTALMMFAVLGYQTTDDDVLGALRAVRTHLKPGALLIFDVWFGPAVIAIRPEKRAKEVARGPVHVTRTADARMDLLAQTVSIRYRVSQKNFSTTHTETAVADEAHTMRFFFPREIAVLLSRCNLALESCTAFPEGGPPTTSTWNVLCVARAV